MERWLKSNPVALQFNSDQIDRDNGIIRDVIIVEAGAAKGHGVHLEESFIEHLINYDQQHFSDTGNKARFGHPSMSDSTMGTQMGYFRNFRKEEGRGIADLHLLKSADKSPTKPQMREWMLSMADEATDFVMCSIVFKPSGYYQYDPEDGSRVDLETSSWGRPRVKFENERVYVDFNEEKGARHYYTDLVESGAATNSLYGQQFNQDKFAVRTIEWLQENPDILQFIRSNPHKILEMCESLEIPISTNMNQPQNERSFFEHVASFFTGSAPDEAPENRVEKTTPAPEAVQPQENALTEEPDTDINQDTPDSIVEEPDTTTSEERFAQIEAKLAQLQQQNNQLKQENEELRKKPQASPTSYTEEVPDADSSHRYLCDTTKKAISRR